MRRPRSAGASALAVVLAAVASIGAVALFAQSSPAPGPRQPFDELFAKGQHTAEAITTLTAGFTETTTSSLLTRPIVSRGFLAVQRPSRVVLRYTEPEERVILIDGDRMTMVWPSRHLTQTSNVAATQRRIQKYLAADSAKELRDQFLIDFRERSERAGTFEFVLTPKRRQIGDALVRLDLWVDRSSYLLTAIRMVFANGDTKTMGFEDALPNAPLGLDTFTLAR